MDKVKALILIANHCQKIERAGDNDGLYFTFGTYLNDETVFAFTQAIKAAYNAPKKGIHFGAPSFDATPEGHGLDWKEPAMSVVRFRIHEGPAKIITPFSAPRKDAPPAVAAEAVWQTIENDMRAIGLPRRLTFVDHKNTQSALVRPRISDDYMYC